MPEMEGRRTKRVLPYPVVWNWRALGMVAERVDPRRGFDSTIPEPCPSARAASSATDDPTGDAGPRRSLSRLIGAIPRIGDADCLGLRRARGPPGWRVGRGPIVDTSRHRGDALAKRLPRCSPPPALPVRLRRAILTVGRSAIRRDRPRGAFGGNDDLHCHRIGTLCRVRLA